MFESEIYFKTSRSSGSGGQNVNKVSTKVELNFDVANSKLLTPEQKQIIFSKLGNRINKAGVLQVTVQETRSQFENKEIALKKFRELLAYAFHRPKKRIKTKVSKEAREKRLKGKKKRSDIKKGRSGNWY
jgi:ribosome-associated protein